MPADTSATGMAGVLADVHRRQFFIALATGTGEWQSSNDAQQFTARYGASRYGVAARPDSLGRVAWQVSWTLRGIGGWGVGPG